MVQRARDGALVAVLLGGGLRRVEAARVRIGDWPSVLALSAFLLEQPTP